MHKNHILIATIVLQLLLTATDSFGQDSKKEAIIKYNIIASLSIGELKSQNHSELAHLLSIEDFIAYYIENGREQQSLKFGWVKFDSLYSDSTFTYFIRRTETYPIRFMKVKSIDLVGINISDIDGRLMRQKFIDEIVPKEDKERVERRCKNSGGRFREDFEYCYDKETKLVEVKYKWKVTCDFIRAADKLYISYYDVRGKVFKD